MYLRSYHPCPTKTHCIAGIDPHANSAPWGFHLWRRSVGGGALTTILLKQAQCLWFGAILFMVLIWKDLVDSTKTLKKRTGMGKTPYIVFGWIASLLIVLMPASIIAESLNIGMMKMLVDVFFALSVFTLMLSSIFYAKSLKKTIGMYLCA